MSAIACLLLSISPFTRSSSASAFWRRRRSARAAIGSSRAAKSVGQRVDAGLQRVGEHLVAAETRREPPRCGHATPLRLWRRSPRPHPSWPRRRRALRLSVPRQPAAPRSRHQPTGLQPPLWRPPAGAARLAALHLSGRRSCRPSAGCLAPLRRSCSFCAMSPSVGVVRDGRSREGEQKRWPSRLASPWRPESLIVSFLSECNRPIHSEPISEPAPWASSPRPIQHGPIGSLQLPDPLGDLLAHPSRPAQVAGTPDTREWRRRSASCAAG